ncbi:serine protease SPPA, chloroplastic-like isoform X2 [Miscanthus floridulus]|uniref:serine protease SPPA, chloroplastic-like isoform X2 n=1 Tax=Miscanthus floridulus TaxID=154761 RepID=UPI003457F3D1
MPSPRRRPPRPARPRARAARVPAPPRRQAARAPGRSSSPRRAVESSPGLTKEEQEPSPAASEAQEQLAPAAAAFEVEELGWGTQLAVKLRMLVAPPWQRVRKGSVLNMKLRGEESSEKLAMGEFFWHKTS